MRAKEFIKDDYQQVDELAPVVAALGGAIARGAAAAGGALARGAATAGSKIAQGASTAGSKIAQGASNLGSKFVQGANNVGKQIGKDLIGPAGTTGTTGSSSAPAAATASPVNVPSNTKIEPIPSNDPKKLQFNIGGATFTLDTTDPKNNQTVQQLKQQLGQQR
jgi:hypothetical protein